MNRAANKSHNLLTSVPFQLLVIILVAFALRVYHLGYRDFWYDEVSTLTQISHFNFFKSWNPPLYNALIYGWVKIFGFSEFSLRFPSLLFSIACVPIAFLLGKELFNKAAGLYASLITALSPFHLWYAQEARAYSIMLFLGIISTYFQLLFINRGQKRFLYWYAAFSVLGFYTNLYYTFLVIAQIICFIALADRKQSKQVFMIFLPLLLSIAPILQKIWTRITTISKGYWVPPPNWRSFLTTVENFNLGFNNYLITYFIFDILALVLLAAAVWYVKQNKMLRRNFIFCLILAVAPALLIFIFSRLFTPIYLDRALITSTPCYYSILGLGISAFKKRISRILALAFILSLFLAGIYGFVKDRMPLDESHHRGVHLKKPVKPMVDFIRENSGPDDIIGFTNDSIALPFVWYDQGKNFFSCLDEYEQKPGRYRFIFRGESLTSSYMQKRANENFDIPAAKIKELEFGKLWVLACDWPRSGNLDKNSLIVKKWLDRNLGLESEKEFDGVWVYRYAR